MGWAASRQRDQETLKQQLDLELTRFQAEIRKVVEQSRSQVAKAAKLTAEQTEKLARSEDLESLPITPAQRKELMTITARAEQLAAVARDAVRQTLAQRSQALDGLFAEKMLPAVRRAAAARGALGVLRSDQMFYFDRKIDLTDIVIDEATKEAPLTFPPAPRLNFPAVRLDDLVGKAPGK
jgi:Skp family chaperone for outer membrane proteins